MTEAEHDALEKMRRHFDRLIGFPEDEWERIVPYLTVVEVGAKHCLQAIGERATRHYFIIDGLVRFYYVTAEGKERNKSFYKENHIVGSLSAVILQEPCRYAIETLEQCTLVQMDLIGLQAVSAELDAWQRLDLYSCRMMLIRNERREAELLTMTAKMRFRQFVRNFPELMQRVPQYHIASYLGVTPEALSKYKRQWLADS